MLRITTTLLLFSLIAYSCSAEKNKNEDQTRKDTTSPASMKTEPKEEAAPQTEAPSETEANDFSSFIAKLKELTTPADLVPRDLEEDELTPLDAEAVNKYVKPYTAKISENDYPYAFNYPDFKSNNYKGIGKISLNANTTVAVFALFYENYTFIGVIAYDKDGKILDGKMAGEEEGGSQVRYQLKSTLDKADNTVVLSSDYIEKHYDSNGKVSKKNPIKLKYKFNLSTNKFEEVK